MSRFLTASGAEPPDVPTNSLPADKIEPPEIWERSAKYRPLSYRAGMALANLESLPRDVRHDVIALAEPFQGSPAPPFLFEEIETEAGLWVAAASQLELRHYGTWIWHEMCPRDREAFRSWINRSGP